MLAVVLEVQILIKIIFKKNKIKINKKLIRQNIFLKNNKSMALQILAYKINIKLIIILNIRRKLLKINKNLN